MGGFAGGDEAGFWDDDIIEFSLNKHNKPKHETLKPQIIINNTLYKISFIPAKCSALTIECSKEVSLESKHLQKVYKALLEFTNDSDITEFFENHKILLTTLESTSTESDVTLSNALVFLHFTKDACNLVLTSDELEEIEKSITE